LKAEPDFKEQFDAAIFKANSKIGTAKEKVQEKNWAEMKKIVLRKRD
jgi:hypothetical protein